MSLGAKVFLVGAIGMQGENSNMSMKVVISMIDSCDCRKVLFQMTGTDGMYNWRRRWRGAAKHSLSSTFTCKSTEGGAYAHARVCRSTVDPWGNKN